jgi:hypothetical protein
MYEHYKEMKRRRGEHDMMNRVHKVYRLLQERGYTGQPVHEVYSDEVQDPTVVQVKLLLSMYHLPKGEGERCTGTSMGTGFSVRIMSMFFWSI